MGRRVRQGLGSTHYPGTREPGRAQADTRQLHQRPDPQIPQSEERNMSELSLKEQQQQKIRTQPGFIAALDQSGGSTPKALQSYGIKQDAWSNEEEMFDLVHQMR